MAPVPRAPRGDTAALLVAASAMSPAPGPGTAGAAGPGAAGRGPGGGACGSRPGTTAVGGSWLPPDISAVGASAGTTGGGVPSSSDPESGGANTVAGSGTPPPSPVALVSVPAHGVPPAGTPSFAVGS